MLRIAGVSKTYPGGVQALRNVSLDIPCGTFGLLGPNGAQDRADAPRGRQKCGPTAKGSKPKC